MPLAPYLPNLPGGPAFVGGPNGWVPATGSIPTAYVAGVGAGSIPYAVRWLAPSGAYGESASEKSGTTVTAKIVVNWEDSTLFTQYARGFAESRGAAGARLLRRWLPLKCPWDNHLYLEHLEFSQHGEDAGPDGVDNWPRATWIEYTCQFKVRDWGVLEDAEADGFGSELSRYVTRKRRYNYKERRTNQFSLEIDDATNPPVQIPDTGFVPFVGSEVEYLWHMVPANLINFNAMHQAFGKVNSLTFDLDGPAGEREIGGPFSPGTLLFLGFSGPWTQYPMSNGKLAFDIPYLFRHNPIGFNFAPRADNTFVKVRQRGTAAAPKYQYDEIDFDTLFKTKV